MRSLLLSRSAPVKLIWVKAHNGDSLNELADRHANLAHTSLPWSWSEGWWAKEEYRVAEEGEEERAHSTPELGIDKFLSGTNLVEFGQGKKVGVRVNTVP